MTLCSSWFLYMDRSGGHCVLEASQWSLDNSMEEQELDLEDDDYVKAIPVNQEERNLGITGFWIWYDVNYGISLAATSFEEFLVCQYFEGWASHNITDLEDEGSQSELPSQLKKWLLQVYSEEGRIL